VRQRTAAAITTERGFWAVRRADPASVARNAAFLVERVIGRRARRRGADRWDCCSSR
jgi:hypothetical protein